MEYTSLLLITYYLLLLIASFLLDYIIYFKGFLHEYRRPQYITLSHLSILVKGSLLQRAILAKKAKL